ncbi:MAG TPA: hypothetical protein VF105_15445 [Gemmatimonadaceae bacterium]
MTVPIQVVRRKAITTALLIWLAAFISITVIGGSLTMDLTGMSGADQYVVSHWGFRGLRWYLWLEAGVLIAIVASLGWHVIRVGLAVGRGDSAQLFGIDPKLRPRMPHGLGYVLVVLGSSLVALSITVIVLFNSCRYMRLI